VCRQEVVCVAAVSSTVQNACAVPANRIAAGNSDEEGISYASGGRTAPLTARGLAAILPGAVVEAVMDYSARRRVFRTAVGGARAEYRSRPSQAG
jgi:hypothetical protein